MPLPELRDIDKAERAKALKEISKRLQLSADTLPSICHYTVLNSCSSVCSMDITDDSSLIALGMADSIIKVCTEYTNIYINTLDTFFRQIKSFLRFRLAFVFGLQTYYLIDFSKIYPLKGLEPKNKG